MRVKSLARRFVSCQSTGSQSGCFGHIPKAVTESGKSYRSKGGTQMTVVVVVSIVLCAALFAGFVGTSFSTIVAQVGSAGRSTVGLAFACVLGLCVLAGCGGASQSTSSTQASSTAAQATSSSNALAATSTTATNAAAKSSSTATAASATTAGVLTPPGTTLKVGQPATVEFDTTLNNGNNGPSYKLGLTIESITLGKISDFNGISLTGVPKGDVPTYVKLTMTNLSSQSINPSNLDPADSVQAIDPNGDADGNLIISGDFPPCQDTDTPSPFSAGQTFTTCETYMEPGLASKIGWNGSNATLDSPVIWSAN
jgi:hypothetical protein